MTANTQINTVIFYDGVLNSPSSCYNFLTAESHWIIRREPERVVLTQ